MKRREQSNPLHVFHLWDWREVTKAIPYLHSVIDSLREHWLELRHCDRLLERSSRRKEPRKRLEILEETDRAADRARAQTEFEDALAELNRVDAYLLDPAKGLALIPFRKEDDLAWYVFDHFTPRGVIGWRYHSDPIEECRPLTAEPEA
jgi:hypothetical protein